jgi:4-amino-4-deoxy-L-arabinose transferase-like glycosyltransferase
MTLTLRRPAPIADRRPALRTSAPRRFSIEQVGLVVALAVAAVLRLVALGGVGLNSDEAVYAAQSASLSGNSHFTGLFPVVRAHPLMLQVLMSPLYHSGVPDTIGRYVAALFGIATVGLVYVLGTVLYHSRAGALAALLLAVMPYHVIVSRQIMLDGPMTFFATASLTCLALTARTHDRRWLIAAGACLGLAALSKETAVILVGSAFVFLCLHSHLAQPMRIVAAGTGLALGIAWSYPLLTALAGGARSGQSYLMWQLTRHPNHSFGFYAVTVGGAIGLGTLAIGIAGLWRPVSRRRVTWRETLLLSWALVPILFFQVWPVKGYAYLLPLAPVAAVLAARTLTPPTIRRPLPRRISWQRRWITRVATVLCVVALAVPSISSIVSPPTSGLAGAGGLPGGREVGRWVAKHVPAGAHFMTIGPSMANVIQYYSGDPSDGLSVSPNPLHRNPTYHPVDNADAALRAGDYQYVVWDAYSAGRSEQFGERARQLARRYHGEVVHVERGTFKGKPDQKLIVVYKVTP